MLRPPQQCVLFLSGRNETLIYWTKVCDGARELMYEN